MRRSVWLFALAFTVLTATAFAQSVPPAAPPATNAPTTTPATTPATVAPQAGTSAGGTSTPAQHGGMKQKWQAKFNTANTSHDGHLTLAQARAAGWTKVASNFEAIDSQKRGYITFNQLAAWHLQQKADKMQQQAASLNAQN